MSLVNIRAALENALAAISDDPVFPTAYENARFKPEVGTPFQSAYLLPADPSNPTMGDNHYREQGIFQVSLYYPTKAGSGAAAARAEVIKAAFYRGASFTSGGVTVRIEATPSVAPGFVDDDGWWVLPIRIRWFADVFN
jgi:hypothetical protein